MCIRDSGCVVLRVKSHGISELVGLYKAQQKLSFFPGLCRSSRQGVQAVSYTHLRRTTAGFPISVPSPSCSSPAALTWHLNTTLTLSLIHILSNYFRQPVPAGIHHTTSIHHLLTNFSPGLVCVPRPFIRAGNFVILMSISCFSIKFLIG